MKVLDYDGTYHLIDKIYDALNSGGSADYIVEEGTSGIWTYRKWASGVAECWGKKTYSDISINNSWGSLYSGYSATPYENYPSGLFISVPKCNVTVDNAGNNCWLASRAEAGDGTATRTPAFQLVRPTSAGATNPIIHYEAKGLWREFTPSVSHQWATMQTGNGTKTSAVASVERCYWKKFGNLVFVAFTFTTASSGITTTSQFFTGLPKPVAYFRFSGALGNTSKACRMSMDTNGNISNAYTVVGDIQGNVVDGCVAYFTNE